MSSNTIIRIQQLAEQFRNAIEYAKENYEKDDLHFFQRFPSGCCGDASDLLAQFLFDNGIKTFQVQGDYCEPDGQLQSHAWLSTEDSIIIDITGDQFKYNKIYNFFDIPVYVGYESNFHKMFEDRDFFQNAQLSNIDGIAQYRLNNLYHKILKYL